jgi:transposase-like protein
MTVKNRYANRSKISEKKIRQIVKLFSIDLDASQVAKISGLNRNTVNRYLTGIRTRVAEFCESQSPFSGEVEVDESFFGARRIKGKRGRGAFGKTIVFGIFRRNGSVFTEIVPDCRKAGWRGYNGLVDLGYKKHFRVNHGQDQFVHDKSHINGIESFWGYAKTRLARFRGMNKKTFYLHLKECEFRFNNRGKNLYLLMLKILRKSPLF